ncbi:MAG: hypothetical protein ACOCXQ_00520 [Patescibacteria group bacterium]
MGAIFRTTIIRLLVLLLVLVPFYQVQAQDLTVTCDAPGSCTADSVDPLFDSSTLWYPGLSVTRTILIENKTGLPQTISTKAENESGVGALDEVLILEITQSSSGLIVYSGTLDDFYMQSEVDLAVFQDGTSDEFDFTVKMALVGNEYAGSMTQFDLLLDFFAEEPSEEDEGLLQITKLNSASTELLPGETVEYTIQVKVGDSSMNNVEVVDLPPAGISYIEGSWQASSSTRGDLKGSGTVSEPQYSSPGVWTIGDAEPGEVITLTYTARVDDAIDPGLYRDIAWANGETQAGSNVVANVSDNNPDPFVGSEVTIAQRIDTEPVRIVQEVEDDDDGDGDGANSGDVLGSSTTVLPQTGSLTGYLLTGLVLIIAGVLTIAMQILSRHASFLERVSLKYRPNRWLFVVPVGLIVFFVPMLVHASDVAVRVERPVSPTNNANFNIGFVALDRQGRSITATCMVQTPGSAGYTSFATYSLKAGGDSGNCPVSSSIISDPGTYQFQVVTTAGAQTDYSEVVTVDYRKVDAPGTPTAYNKKKEDCSYRISFKTAKDDGRTSRVEIYRSRSTSFTAEDATRVEVISAGSDEDVSVLNSVPDCGDTYYYAARAFNEFNDGSGIVADREVRVIGGTSTGGGSGDAGAVTAGTTTAVAGAIPVAAAPGDVVPGVAEAAGDDDTGTGDVAGADTGEEDDETGVDGEVQGVNESAPEADTGDVKGTDDEVDADTDISQNNLVILGIILVIVGGVILGYVILSKQKK